MKLPFKYYLHDSYSSSEFQEVVLEDQLGLDDSMTKQQLDELMQKIGRPFYEVTLECELDTETGKVTVLDSDI